MAKARDGLNVPRLLKKYMQHIISCESISYVRHIDDGWGSSEVQFDDDEILYLRDMAIQMGCPHLPSREDANG